MFYFKFYFSKSDWLITCQYLLYLRFQCYDNDIKLYFLIIMINNVIINSNKHSFVLLELFDRDWIWIRLVVLHVFHIPICDLIGFIWKTNLSPPIQRSIKEFLTYQTTVMILDKRYVTYTIFSNKNTLFFVLRS